jgi:hypothetical protein
MLLMPQVVVMLAPQGVRATFSPSVRTILPSSAVATDSVTSAVESVPVMLISGEITVDGRSAQEQFLKVPMLWLPSLLDGQHLHAITVVSA